LLTSHKCQIQLKYKNKLNHWSLHIDISVQSQTMMVMCARHDAMHKDKVF